MNGSTASLLNEIETHCRDAGIAESTFGRQAVNDGKLCVRLRAGKNVTLETAQRVRDYIRQQFAARGQSHQIQCRGKSTSQQGG